MATISRQKVWVTGDTLTAADLNAEFNNIVNDYNGGITNANIASGAAIAYSKLNLTGNIVNADIGASAAIAYSKLNLTGAILNADLAGSIDASKITNTAATLTGTETLTNKRITKRSNTITSHATPTINTDTTDIFTITAQAEAITSMTTNLSGTPTNGQTLVIRILDNGTARAITWGASFASRGATLPTTTVLSKYLYVGLIWNSTASVWDCIAVSQEA